MRMPPALWCWRLSFPRYFSYNTLVNKQQAQIDRWFSEQKWPYWTAHEILARLVEEVGEFARLINHDFGPKPKKADEAPQDYEDEIGDILYALACFANAHDIDLDAALQRSVDKVESRDKDRFAQQVVE